VSIRDIAIDFEGEGSTENRTGKHPLLLGAIVPNQPSAQRPWSYRAYLLDPVLAPMTRPPRDLKGVRSIATLAEAVQTLVVEAENRDCKLVGYTEHELDIVELHLKDDPELCARFSAVYRNVAEDVRNYLKSKNRCPKRGELSLERALQLMGSRLQLLPKPSKNGVGEACRRLINAGTGRKKWNKWAPTQKQLARDFLLYNRRDCEAIRALIARLQRLGAYPPSPAN
jgi:hypothetical protein